MGLAVMTTSIFLFVYDALRNYPYSAHIYIQIESASETQILSRRVIVVTISMSFIDDTLTTQQ